MKHKPNFYVIPELAPAYEVSSLDGISRRRAAVNNEMVNTLAESYMNYMRARYLPERFDNHINLHTNEIKQHLINFFIFVMETNNDEANKG